MLEQNIGEKVVSDLKKDFRIVGSHRVHSWYAWAIVGIVFGMALGIVYVANRSAQFNASNAMVVPKDPQGIIEQDPESEFALSSDPQGLIKQNEVTMRGTSLDDKIKCFIATDDVPVRGDEVPVPKIEDGKARESYWVGQIFFNGWHYDQMNAGACEFVSLLNMDIDFFHINLGPELFKCAAEKGISWEDGNTRDEWDQILACKSKLLIEHKLFDILLRTYGVFNQYGFNREEDISSPCKKIDAALAGGGGATITLRNSKEGNSAHVAEVINVDCKKGTMIIRDPNGFDTTLSFDKNGDITNIDPPTPLDKFYIGARIKSFTTETRKK